MNKNLAARPNLEYLKSQAKFLLSDLKSKQPHAIEAFNTFNLDTASPKLADAQFVVARHAGFESWPRVVRYIEQLNNLEGSWEFKSLVVGGTEMPGAAFANSQLVINGDRFNMLSPEGDYIGIFNIRVDAEPFEIDIEFIEGPEAGNSCFGIFQAEGNTLTICLGLVGATRPSSFVSEPGTQYALEVLTRVTSQAPIRKPSEATPLTPSASKGDPADFQDVTSGMLALQGEWLPLEIINDGKPLPANFMPMGRRTCEGSRVTVVFGGQKMVDVFAKAFDDGTIDYLVASGPKANDLQYGIYSFDGDVLSVCMADSGQPRPTEFSSVPGSGHTLTRWRKN